MKKILLLLLFFTFISHAQWQQTALTTGNVFSLAGNENYIFAGEWSLYVTTDNGGSWNVVGGVIIGGTHVSAVCVKDAYVFVTGIVLNRSTNNGANWTQYNLSAADGFESLTASGNNVFVGTHNYGIRRSTNNGENWSVLTTGFPTVYSLASNGDNIFAGVQNWGFYRSTNNGENWIQTLTGQRINALVNINNIIYAGTDINGVYISTDNGTSWAQTSLNNRKIRSLAMRGNNIFAGTDTSGVYISTNNGASWVQKNEGLINLRAESLLISGNYVFAGTYGNGVWKRPLSEVIGILPISNEVPNQFFLSQNYPNPFNPNTVISFQLAVNSFATLKVYDILGREVATLVNEQLQPGTYEVDWDGTNFPSGVYYYKMIADDFTETKKMVLIK